MESTSFTVTLIIEMVSNFVGGLCIFLLGMKYLSDGVQAVAGERMRKMIAMVTDNRLAACGTGLFVTSVIQSSSVTTVMLVGLVNAGVMTLQQSIGVILGADIGTTVTAWIVAISITKYGLIMTGISGFFYLFTSNERHRFIAMLIMGLGLVFFGLHLMEKGVAPLRSHQEFILLFSRFSPKNYFGVINCILIGAFVTAIIQSSSATVAITITLARTGVIDFETSVALVLGQNIGTTITAFLASLGVALKARRVAYAHIGIKIVAVILMFPFFFLYLQLLEHIAPVSLDIAKRIALAHTVFNVLFVLVFLPFTSIFSRVLFLIFKDKKEGEPPALTYLDVRMLDAPALSIEQSRREIMRMGETVGAMMNSLYAIISGEMKNKERLQTLFNQEELLDRMQKEVVVFLTRLLTIEVVSAVSKEAQEQLRYADEFESVSDYIVAILKLHLRLENAHLILDREEQNDILALHTAVNNYYRLIYEAYEKSDRGVLTRAYPEGEGITHLYREMRSRHLTKLSQKRLDPLICTLYPDILAAYRRIKEHLLNVAEAIIS
ncbi:MAG: Na/Pi cotransporter family protein [Chitinispirillaceae bacterium]|nr:Na/Pi cotransporter family protein [Chitinispirillaceae bacterium]